jgi:hypothetical protein
MAATSKRPYIVVLSEEMAHVPAAILRHLRVILREIGQACDAIPSTSPFWETVAAGDLIVDVGTWRFTYTMNREEKRIMVKSCKPLREG